MLVINNIDVEIVEPLNILPDGTMDRTKSEWCCGGVAYKVQYSYNGEDRTEALQLEGNVWYEPCYQISNASMVVVLTKIAELEDEMYSNQ